MFNESNTYSGFGVTPTHLQQITNVVFKNIEVQKKKKLSPSEMSEIAAGIKLAYVKVREINAKTNFSMSEVQEDTAAKTIIKNALVKSGINL